MKTFKIENSKRVVILDNDQVNLLKKNNYTIKLVSRKDGFTFLNCYKDDKFVKALRPILFPDMFYIKHKNGNEYDFRRSNVKCIPNLKIKITSGTDEEKMKRLKETRIKIETMMNQCKTPPPNLTRIDEKLTEQLYDKLGFSKFIEMYNEV